MSQEKVRLDILLVDKNFFESRERARAAIMEGDIYIKNEKQTKAGEKFTRNTDIEYRGKKLKYVSRGGLKLEKALNSFNINLNNKICMDVGASTGGFTDCMLKNGASKIYSVDVGYGQLAWKLRTDSRVVNLERENIRYIENKKIMPKPEFVSIDVAFISLKKIIDKIIELSNINAEIIALIKPQFEAGRDKVGKKGVVKELETHLEVCDNIYDIMIEKKLQVIDFSYSPIKGPEGNIEFLIYLSKKNNNNNFAKNKILKIIKDAYKNLM